MRITIVQGAFLPVPPLLGGAVEKVWFALGKEFARRGHEVVHVSRGYKELPRSETVDGVRHRRVSGFSSPASTPRRLLLDLWYAMRVLPVLPRADILVTNTFWLPALVVGRSRGIPYVHVARYPKRQLRLYRGAVLQTVSEPIRDAILAEVPGAAKRTRVIPYPLSERYLSPELGTASRTILYTGRVHPEKGLHLLISAFARLPATLRSRWKLQIVGPSEIAFGGGGEAYLDELKRLAGNAGVDFVGRVFDEARLISHYRDARVFVYPSLAEKGETFGLAALEGMASGCAPLVSDLACFRDFIRAEVNGRIFDHRSTSPVDSLAEKLAEMLQDDEATDRIRHAAWLTARDYTLNKIANDFLADFASLCHLAPLPRPAAAFPS